MNTKTTHSHRPFPRLLASLGIVLALFAGGGLGAQEIDPSEVVLDYLSRHSDRVALVHYGVNPDGTINDSIPSLNHRGDLPLPLASTVKIMVLATYAREVDAGRLDPSEPISLGEWQKHYHPFFDEHPEVLASLGIATDAWGFALDPTETVPLDVIAKVMIQDSDNTATDYFLARLGRERIEATIAEAGLTAQETPFTLKGLLMTLLNHDQGPVTESRLQTLLTMDRAAFMAEADRLESLYWDPEWREIEVPWIIENMQDAPFSIISTLLDTQFPKGTAHEYARVMAQVVTGNFLSPTVSSIMREHLERDIEGTFLEDLLLTLGTKGGDMAGTLNSAFYAIPQVGELAGQPVVSILFINGLPEEIGVDEFSEPILFFLFRLWLDATWLPQIQENLCTPNDTTACLNEGRFRVRLAWQDYQSREGVGHVVPLTSSDSGLLWMFNPENWEFLVKVLDGCSVNGHYWFLSAAATDVQYTLRVTDMAEGVTREYGNPLGNASPALIDTAAFATCNENE